MILNYYNIETYVEYSCGYLWVIFLEALHFLLAVIGRVQNMLYPIKVSSRMRLLLINVNALTSATEFLSDPTEMY